MAARAALLLGVLLLIHRPGDAGEAPRDPPGVGLEDACGGGVDGGFWRWHPTVTSGA